MPGRTMMGGKILIELEDMGHMEYRIVKARNTVEYEIPSVICRDHVQELCKEPNIDVVIKQQKIEDDDYKKD
jgi:hypothetical protein